jgi:predicted thioredoxin/glutaredoxin
MSYKVTKLIVGKGKTTSDEQNGEWIKNYYEVEIDVPDEHELSIAKENAEGLLNEWLGTQKTSPATLRVKWDSTKINWVEADGTHGKYERSEDVNSLDFKEAMKDLEAHGGKLSRKENDGTWFYWKFEKSAIIGRKKKAIKND